MVGRGLAVASHDRQTWSWLSRSLGPGVPHLFDAISTGDGLLSLGMEYVGTEAVPVILRSEDGRRFRVEHPSGLAGRHLPLKALAWGGGRYLTVGPLAWAVSDDGLTWSAFAVAPGAALELPLRGTAWVGDRFVAVGDGGSVAWSSNGLTWTVASPPPGGATLRAVAAGGGVVVAVGEDGAGVTTADWTTWQPWTTGTSANLRAIAWGDGRFVAVAEGGTVATSDDGYAWQVATLPAHFPLADVAWTANGFVAVGADGAFASRDGLAWTLVPPESALTGTFWGTNAAVVPWGAGAVVFDGAEVLGLAWSSPAEVAGGGHAWVVPAAAHADGLAGTRWRSDLLLENPGPEPALLEATLLERARDNTAATPRTNTLLPGTTARLADLVRDTFGAAAAAGAVLVGSSAALVVDSRTSNDGGAGTYGQRVPAVPVGDALAAGARAVLPGLGRDARRRTNLGAVSLSGSPTMVRFEVFAGNGDPLGQVDLELPPFGSGQRSDALVDLGELPDAYAVVSSASPDARFVPYASVVDASTGDPAYVGPVPGLAGRAVVPAVASLPGAGGTHWRSDLALVNPGVSAAAVRLELVPRDQDGTDDLPTTSVAVPPGHQVIIADLVGSLFGVTAAGALHLDVEQGEVVAASRTWTASGEGSFGQDVPAIPTEEAVRTGEVAVLVGLAESCDSAAGFRSNLGLVNLGLAPITVTGAASHGDGTPIGSVDLEVPANGNLQRDRILAALGACEVSTGVVEVSSATPGARFLAYASVVDNATGDPVFVTPPPATAVR